jgi:L-malate glycosyltransferase
MTIAVISMIRDSWGGSEELWYQMAKKALMQGHNVLHLRFDCGEKHPKLMELERLGLKGFIRPSLKESSNKTRQLFLLGSNFLKKRFSRSLKKVFEEEPDVIIYNGTCYSVASEKTLIKYIKEQKSKRSRFYIIGHLNHEFSGGLPIGETNAVIEAYELSRKVFFVSKRSLSVAQRHLSIPISHWNLIRNPVNMSSTELLPLPTSADQVNLASVGNLVTAHKGQDILLQALSQWKFSNWKLNIYGSGFDNDYLQRLTRFLNLEDKVTFHGTVSDIRTVWQSNHILVMPSIMEGMPLAVVEAMLCGRICIVTNVGGHKEWITDSVNGFIAGAPTVDSILSALDKALMHKESWPEMAKRAHDTAINMYDPDAGGTLLKLIGS